MLNKDGLKIGKPVDFETMQRVNRERKERLAVKPKRTRKPKAKANDLSNS